MSVFLISPSEYDVSNGAYCICLKPILKHACTYSITSSLVLVLVIFHTLCMQAVMAQVRLYKCAIKPNFSALANMFWVSMRHTKTVLLIVMLIEFYQKLHL